MNWDWATSLDHLWRSPTFPMWLTLAAAGFFGLIVLLTLLRAEKSVANGALTVITLLAIAVAVAATIRGFGPGGAVSGAAGRTAPIHVAMPALSCIDDLAGDAVEEACEKALFGTPDTTAAAVSYAASEVDRLRSFGDVAAANRVMSPELQALRRAVERDRYGLVAYVLVARDRCTPTDCAAFQSLTDHNQVAANMQERIYEERVSRYATAWSTTAPAAAAAAAASTVPGMAAMPASVPTGKPTNAEFPTSASIPPVNIMTPEPAANAAAPQPAPAAAQAVPTPRPAPSQHRAAPARKPAPKPHVAAPVRIAPEPPSASTQN